MTSREIRRIIRNTIHYVACAIRGAFRLFVFVFVVAVALVVIAHVVPTTTEAMPAFGKFVAFLEQCGNKFFEEALRYLQ